MVLLFAFTLEGDRGVVGQSTRLRKSGVMWPGRRCTVHRYWDIAMLASLKLFILSEIGDDAIQVVTLRLHVFTISTYQLLRCILLKTEVGFTNIKNPFPLPYLNLLPMKFLQSQRPQFTRTVSPTRRKPACGRCQS